MVEHVRVGYLASFTSWLNTPVHSLVNCEAYRNEGNVKSDTPVNWHPISLPIKVEIHGGSEKDLLMNLTTNIDYW